MRRLVLLILALFAAPAAGAELRIGWDGFYKPGRWLPAFVTAADDGGPRAVDVELYVPGDPAGGPFGERVVSSQTLAAEPSTFAVLVRPRGDLGGLTLRVIDRATGRTLDFAAAPPTEPVLGGRRLLAVSGLGDPLAGLGSSAEDPASADTGLAVAAVAPGRLPRRALAYGALDALVLDRPDWAALGRPRAAAIADWLDAGGRLVLIPGVDPLPPDSPLARRLPATLGDVRPDGVRAATPKPGAGVLTPGRGFTPATSPEDGHGTDLPEAAGVNPRPGVIVGAGVAVISFDVAADPPADRAAFWRRVLDALGSPAEPPAVTLAPAPARTSVPWWPLAAAAVFVAAADAALLGHLCRRPWHPAVVVLMVAGGVGAGLALAEALRRPAAPPAVAWWSGTSPAGDVVLRQRGDGNAVTAPPPPGTVLESPGIKR